MQSIYTHEHADQTAGIFEFRPLYFKKRKRIPIFCNKETKKRLRTSYPWLFSSSKLYPQIMKIQSTQNNFLIQKKSNKIKFSSLKVFHGSVATRGYLFKKIAYISDCKELPKTTLEKIKNLDVLIIDCFRKTVHVTHLDFENTIKIINYLKPKKAFLTNMHIELDYNFLKKKLPANIIPAYDGLSFNF